MEIPTLVGILDEPHLAAEQLGRWGLRDTAQAQQSLRQLADCGLSLDVLAALCEQLQTHLPQAPAPDEALAGLARYFRAVRSPLALAALFERDPEALPTLLGALGLGSQWADLLIADPDALDLLLRSAGPAQSGQELLEDLVTELASLGDDRSMASALARFRQRRLLKIAFNEVRGGGSPIEAASQLSGLGQTLVQAALRAVDAPPALAVLAVGDLGGQQCSYRLDFPLLVVYEPRPAAIGDAHAAAESAARHLARLLSESLAGTGQVELLRLPEGSPTALAHTADDVVHGFDSFGRTWHRQQMLKARPVAGDRELGRRVSERLLPWLFRRYLNRADEAGIQALKRRILIRGALHQDDWRQPRLARGGIADIEATVELLQLVVGNEQLAVREANTLAALAGLVAAGAIAAEDRDRLAANYALLKRLLHQLQIRFGPAAEELPAGFGPAEKELRERLDESWAILQRLLTSVFPEAGSTAREVELLLDPSPSHEEIRAALAPFGFRDAEGALRELNDLATEQIPFLSTRRCRHLLARILPRLLCAIAATPDPDWTLVQLARVSNSLGGKAVLWDLFHTNPPTLELYTKLCAASPYLSDILTTNPGMIDELVDSLQLDRLPSRTELRRTLEELLRGAGESVSALHDLKNAAHLRIGVRDILGKDDIDATHASLADVAETCLAHAAESEYQRLVEKHGIPTIGMGDRAGERSRLVLVALGKLGGREPNYHSRLEMLLLYEADGTTRPTRPSQRKDATANNHFFTRLTQQTIKQLSELTPKGRLYAVDVPLRPIGIGGALAMTFEEFANHFATGGAPLWQWQALTQARTVYGDEAALRQVDQTLRSLLIARPWTGGEVAELRRSRLLLERDAGPLNLKRAPGGTLDVEFLVQMLLLQQAARRPEVLVTNTQTAIALLGSSRVLAAELAERLGDNYRFLRRVESGLRLLNTAARHDFPSDAVQLTQLAFLLGHSNPERLREQCIQSMADNRRIFDELTAE